MIIFDNQYRIDKIAPELLSIQFRGKSVTDSMIEDGKYYYAAERQCKDTAYDVVKCGLFRKPHIVTHSYTRDFYLALATNCIKTILRTEMPADKVSGPAADIYKYALVVYTKVPVFDRVYAKIVETIPFKNELDAFYETVDKVGVDPSRAEMLDLGLFYSPNMIRMMDNFGYRTSCKIEVDIKFPELNGRYYNIFHTKNRYDIPMSNKEHNVICKVYWGEERKWINEKA